MTSENDESFIRHFMFSSCDCWLSFIPLRQQMGTASAMPVRFSGRWGFVIVLASCPGDGMEWFSFLGWIPRRPRESPSHWTDTETFNTFLIGRTCPQGGGNASDTPLSTRCVSVSVYVCVHCCWQSTTLMIPPGNSCFLTLTVSQVSL